MTRCGHKHQYLPESEHEGAYKPAPRTAICSLARGHRGHHRFRIDGDDHYIEWPQKYLMGGVGPSVARRLGE